jgi:hypothetical protein
MLLVLYTNVYIGCMVGTSSDSLLFLISFFWLNRVDDARLPLSRIVPIPSNQLNLYRIVIILRFIILCFFFQYRITHPVPDAYGLWLTSVICEIWFALSWLLDQFPKWHPINRETYIDRLALRFIIFLLCWCNLELLYLFSFSKTLNVMCYLMQVHYNFLLLSALVVSSIKLSQVTK